MSNMTVAADELEKRDEFLGVDEISAAFDALSQDDKLKLAAVESIRRSGTEFEPGELIHVAVYRALVGDRKCPRDIPFIAFMAMTMRSIATHSRRERQRTVASPEVTAGERNPDGHADPPTPEDNMLQKEAAERITTIYGHLDDDQEAQLVLMGWADELQGRELCDATGLDQPALDYAKKRIRIAGRRLYPDGWKS